MKVLLIEDLHKYFPLKKGMMVNAVNGINISIKEGKTLGLVGESGCGKTTVGKCIVKLHDPTSGKIVFLERDVTRMSQKKFRELRAKVQFVFQEPYDALNPRKKVKKIFLDPLILDQGLNRNHEKRIKELLEMVELGDDVLNKYPVQLTQGEQQRIGVARAIATNPKLVVLDEPTSLLDIHFRAEIVFLLKRLQEQLGIAYLFISHDLVVISQLSHYIAVMYLGRIVEQGPTSKIFNSPLHPYTKALFNAALFPDPEQKRSDFFLKGEVPSPINLANNKCNFAPRCPLAKKPCYETLPMLEDKGDEHFVACFYTGRSIGNPDGTQK